MAAPAEFLNLPAYRKLFREIFPTGDLPEGLLARSLSYTGGPTDSIGIVEWPLKLNGTSYLVIIGHQEHDVFTLWVRNMSPATPYTRFAIPVLFGGLRRELEKALSSLSK